MILYFLNLSIEEFLNQEFLNFWTFFYNYGIDVNEDESIWNKFDSIKNDIFIKGRAFPNKRIILTKRLLIEVAI